MMKAILILTMMISPIIAINISEDITRPLTEHPLHLGWLCHSVIGVAGVILNSLVILILYLERSSLVSSINVMIMSVYSVYSVYTIQYRCTLYSLVSSINVMIMSVGHFFSDLSI